MGLRSWWQSRGQSAVSGLPVPVETKAHLSTPDGLPITHLPVGYTAMLSLYGLRGTYGALYKTQPNVRAVVDFLAEEAASVKLKTYEKVPSSPLLPSGRIELGDHPMMQLLNRPSPRVTRTRLWRDTVTDIGIYDVAFWQKIRDPFGRVRAVVRQPPAAMTPERDPTTQALVRYTTTLGGTIELDDLVVFHGYDPELHDGQVSPLETLRRILAEEASAGSHRQYLYKNATRKSGIVERPVEAPEWTGEEREAWRADWEGVMSGDTNSGRVGLLEDGMSWKESSWSPEEMEYLAARKLTRLESAALYRVDPTLVFAAEGKVDKEIRTGFYVDRLNPLLTRMAEEVELQLLPEFEPFDAQHRVYCQFNIDEKLRGSFEEQAKVASSAVGGPYITVNEMRARLNLPPVEDGDKVFSPLNSIRAGGPQANPQAPIETPGDDPASGETPGDGVQRAAVNEEQLRSTALRYAELLSRHFARQGRTVIGMAGAINGRPVTIDQIWADQDRWDRELTKDLFQLTTELLPSSDRRTVELVQHLIQRVASAINGYTYKLTTESISDLGFVFSESAQERAAKLGLSFAQMLTGAATGRVVANGLIER